MSDITPFFVTKYEAEFELALQQSGSLLRDRVRCKTGVVGNAVRFPVYGAVAAQIDRPITTPLTPNPEQVRSTVTATLHRVEAWDAIDHLQEFMTNVDERSALTQSVVMTVGRKFDKFILDAAVASNTSTFSAAAQTVNRALLSNLDAETAKYFWGGMGGMRTWVVSPEVWAQITQIDQFGSFFYNNNKPLVDGADGPQGQVKHFMGMDFLVHPMLGVPQAGDVDYRVDATHHNTYLIQSQCLGLGIGSDIKPVIERRTDLNAMQVLCDGSAGAVTIQATGVLKINCTITAI